MDLSKIDLSVLTDDERTEYDAFLEQTGVLIDTLQSLPREEAKGELVAIFAHMQQKLVDHATQEAQMLIDNHQQTALENPICAWCKERCPTEEMVNHWRTCANHPAGVEVRKLTETLNDLLRTIRECAKGCVNLGELEPAVTLAQKIENGLAQEQAQ